MIAAVSTACLYPMQTEEALRALCLAGVDTVEIFLNSLSECCTAYAELLRGILSEYGTQCRSVHPCSAPMEGFMLFSEYTRRYKDFIDDARRVFALMQIIGARYYVLHGAPAGYTEPAFYCERFAMLCEAAKPFGVCVTQENVVNHACGSLDFLRQFCEILGADAKITFDVKQAVRSGKDRMDIARAVQEIGRHIVHVHMSDHGAAGDCLRIGQGGFAAADFLKNLHAQGFDGAVTLELYREAFDTPADLAADWQTLRQIICQCESAETGK